MMIDGESPVTVNDLEPDSVSPCDFYGGDGLLLIAAGVKVTTSLIENLRTRGVRALHPRNVPAKFASAGAARKRAAKPNPRKSVRPDLLSATYDAARVQRIRKQFVAGERAVTRLCESFRRNRHTDLREVEPHVDNYINELADDPDPILGNALRYQADLDLAQRCVRFSVLSLAIARQMDISEEEVRAVGSTALVHDWGLFEMPHDSRFPHQINDESTRTEYLRHPITAAEMLGHVEGVSPWVMMYVAQVHELLDGTGFPRGLTASEIQVGSRILGVADAYLTMTCPPDDSPRIVPCDAIAYLISGASQSRYSAAAVTGLLKSVTLYPIGSIVELNDTSLARVIRSNGNDYGYPIVETLTGLTRVINLKEAEMFVTRPVTSASFNEVRLPESYTELSQALSQAS